jgi:flagellar basal-body rod protein FlgF
MIYGLYLSASGVRASAHRIDVAANNLANSETTGFKRDLSIFQERPTEAAAAGLPPRQWSNPDLEGLGGGVKLALTSVDLAPGNLEQTGNQWDFALQGKGFFAVKEGSRIYLTRDGRFGASKDEKLILASGGQQVLDRNRQPITIKNHELPFSVNADGTIFRHDENMGMVGVFDVPDPRQVVKYGQGLLAYDDLDKRMLPQDNAKILNGYLEQSNAEPTHELTTLIEAQRSLDANASMIRYQDETLSRLVNDVGKFS